MQDRPTATELLEAVGRFLAEEVVPAVDGPRRFHARVAANLMAILARERELEEAHLEAEWERLRKLLRTSASRPQGRDALRSQVRQWTEDLCARIRAGEVDEDGPRRRDVLEHVRRTVREKLDVANPRFGTSSE